MSAAAACLWVCGLVGGRDLATARPNELVFDVVERLAALRLNGAKGAMQVLAADKCSFGVEPEGFFPGHFAAPHP